MYTATVRAAAVTERDIFLPSFSLSGIVFSSSFSLSIRRSAVVPNISASLKRLAAVGEEAPDSHFVNGLSAHAHKFGKSVLGQPRPYAVFSYSVAHLHCLLL